MEVGQVLLDLQHLSNFQGTLLEAGWEVRYVHGNINKYPIVPLEIKGKTNRVKALVNSRLTHLIIPGTDWLGECWRSLWGYIHDQ